MNAQPLAGGLGGAIAAGLALALLTCLLHYAASRWLLRRGGGRFFLWFPVSLVARFASIVGLLVLVYHAGIFDPLRFTISFVISYLIFSVMEMRLLLRIESGSGD